MDAKLLLLYAILIACVLILLLSVYKVYKWTKKEEAIKIFSEIKKQQEKKHQLTFATPMYKFQGLLFWFMLGMLLVSLLIFSLGPYDKEFRHMIGKILLASIFTTIVLNNIIVHKYWRCPFCQEKLPIRIGRSGARPKTVYSCPHCQKDFLAK